MQFDFIKDLGICEFKKQETKEAKQETKETKNTKQCILVYSIYILNDNLPMLYDYLISIKLSLFNLKHGLPVDKWKIRIYVHDSINTLLDKELYKEHEKELDKEHEELENLLSLTSLKCREIYKELQEDENIDIIQYKCSTLTIDVIGYVRFFRLLPLLEEDIHICICKDADSILSLAECINILNFSESNEPFYLTNAGIPLYLRHKTFKTQGSVYKQCGESAYSEWLNIYNKMISTTISSGSKVEQTYIDFLAGLIGFKRVQGFTFTIDDFERSNMNIQKLLSIDNNRSYIFAYDELFLTDLLLKYNTLKCPVDINDKQEELIRANFYQVSKGGSYIDILSLTDFSKSIFSSSSINSSNCEVNSKLVKKHINKIYKLMVENDLIVYKEIDEIFKSTADKFLQIELNYSSVYLMVFIDVVLFKIIQYLETTEATELKNNLKSFGISINRIGKFSVCEPDQHFTYEIMTLNNTSYMNLLNIENYIISHALNVICSDNSSLLSLNFLINYDLFKVYNELLTTVDPVDPVDPVEYKEIEPLINLIVRTDDRIKLFML